MSHWRIGTPRKGSWRRSLSIFCVARSAAAKWGNRGPGFLVGTPGQVGSGLERREYRCGYDVLFDLADPGDVLGGDAHRLPLLFGPVVGEPEMHDPVPDDDVRCPHVNPLLSGQFSDQLLTDRVVVAIGIDRRFALRHRQGPHEVRPADDADELAVAKDRHALDSLCLE